MATRYLIFAKFPFAKSNLFILRSSQNIKHSLRLCQYSTTKELNSVEKSPVKFTSSSASKVTIEETIGLKKPTKFEKIRKYVFLASWAVFLLYFCVLREENDLDEIISGNSSSKSDAAELVDLKIKLAYCEKANLPTSNLKAKIQEIVERNQKPVFPK